MQKGLVGSLQDQRQESPWWLYAGELEDPAPAWQRKLEATEKQRLTMQRYTETIDLVAPWRVAVWVQLTEKLEEAGVWCSRAMAAAKDTSPHSDGASKTHLQLSLSLLYSANYKHFSWCNAQSGQVLPA